MGSAFFWVQLAEPKNGAIQQLTKIGPTHKVSDTAGNSLEKLIASRRIAVFEMNPGIKAARNPGAVQTSFPVADHPQEIQWQAFWVLSEGKKAIVIDARPAKLYEMGHVPGAINISREQFAADYEKEKASVEADRERPVVVYCNGLDCEDSKMVSGALIKLGFRRVLLYKGGWQEWTFQHLPEEK
jgi:rhodanese-related sulfurtransferase